MLLCSGAAVNSRAGNGLTPLHMACEQEHVETIKVLLSTAGCDMNMKDNDGDTPLLLALKMEKIDSAKILLRSGADPNNRNKDGWSPLLWACKEGHWDIVDLLLEAGADPCVRNHSGTCSLHIATEYDHITIVRTLLTTKGVYVNMHDDFLIAAIHIAARMGNNRMLLLLLEKGADPGLCTKKGSTALTLACQYGHADTAALLIRLTGFAVNINAADKDGWTALHWAVMHKMTDLVVLMIEVLPDDIEVNKPSTVTNQTALILAAIGGVEYMVYFLLLHGADPLFHPGDEHTALFEASEHGHLSITRMLMEVVR
jgi:ankyrin repeat protein